MLEGLTCTVSKGNAGLFLATCTSTSYLSSAVKKARAQRDGVVVTAAEEQTTTQVGSETLRPDPTEKQEQRGEIRARYTSPDATKALQATQRIAMTTRAARAILTPRSCAGQKI